jgi:gas vesicle protein
MSKGFTFILGLLIGGLIGWVLGIISAPQSGKDTRDDIEEKALEFRDMAKGAAARMENEMLGPLNSTANLDADYTR